MSGLGHWRVTGSRIVLADRWIRVRADSCVAPSGDVVDPFGHVEDHHTRMMASLDEAARIRAIGAGERLGPEDAVEQALELLRSLDRAS